MQVNSVKPAGPDGENCPHMGGRPCNEVCHTCTMWMPIREHGIDGKTITEGFECAHKITAFGTLKVAREVRQNCATTDKVKNNVDRLRETMGTENLKISALLKPVFEVLAAKGVEQQVLENQLQRHPKLIGGTNDGHET